METQKKNIKLGVVVRTNAKQPEPPVTEVSGATSADGVSKAPPGRKTRLGRSKMKWTHQSNIILWECYIRSEPLVRGYMDRMYDIWTGLGMNGEVSAQRLAVQVRNIKAKNMLSELEREEVMRKVYPSNDN